MYAATTSRRSARSAAIARRACAAFAATGLLLLGALSFPAVVLADDSWEPDDARLAVPEILSDGGAMPRGLDTEGDIDWVALEVTEGHTYVIEAVPPADDPWFDTRLDVFDSVSGLAFASDDDGGTNLMPKVVLTAAASGTWHVRVTGFSFWTTGTYTLRVYAIEAATVRGSVAGVGGIARPGVTVTAYAPDTSGWDVAARTTSDESGRYALTLEAGAYRLAYNVGGGTYPTRYWLDADTLGEADSLPLEPGESLDTGQVSVIEWARVTGSVTGWDGTAVPTGISVAAYRFTGTEWRAFSWTMTDSSGSWSLPIASGTYRFGYTDRTGGLLPAFQPDASTVDGAEDVVVDGAPVTLSARLAAPARIEGTVRDALDGEPVDGVSVSLVKRTDTGWTAQAQSTTLDDGTFAIDHQTGTYALWFSTQDGSYCDEHVTDLELGADGLTVDVELQPAAILSGRITQPGTGIAVAGAVIEAYHLDAETNQWLATASARSGTDGAYSIPSLPAGAYRVSAVIDGAPATTRFYRDAITFESATDISASAGQTTRGIDIRVSSDTRAPVTSADTDRILVAPATIQLLATDDTTVARTYYRLDGGAWLQGTSVAIGVRGEHTLEYYSVDAAGNAEEPALEMLLVRESSVTVNALAGADRYETAVRISKESFPGGAATLIVVTGTSWPDGLGAASLAGALDAPILLVKPGAVPSAVAEEVRRLLPTRVVIIGGEFAVGEQVAAHFEHLVGADNVERIGGADRYETARLVAEASLMALDRAGRGWDGTYVLASGLSFPDVLAASPLSAAQGWPVLLTRPDRLTGSTSRFIDQHAGAHALIVGGPAAISVATEADAAAQSGAAGYRLSGKDRYETALGIAAYAADRGLLGYQHLAIATGQDFPDALTCSVRQARAGSVLLLTPRSSLDSDVAAMLESLTESECSDVTFVGGAAAISQPVRQQVIEHLAR